MISNPLGVRILAQAGPIVVREHLEKKGLAREEVSKRLVFQTFFDRWFMQAYQKVTAELKGPDILGWKAKR